MGKIAVIIGAGPAGLTAALELLRRTDIKPIVLEASGEIGGISRTIRYKGNRMDIGGHRFFSKSDRVMRWWMDLMPPETAASAEIEISYQGRKRLVKVPAHLEQEPPLRGLGPLHHEAHSDAEEEASTVDEVVEAVEVAPPVDPDLVMLIRPAQEPDLLFTEVLRLPDQADEVDTGKSGPGAHRQGRCQLSKITRKPD